MTDLINHRAVQELVAESVREAWSIWETQQAKLADGRISFPEAEAAALLGLAPHVLRDARYRGEIRGRKVGKQWVYTRAELLRLVEPER